MTNSGTIIKEKSEFRMDVADICGEEAWKPQGKNNDPFHQHSMFSELGSTTVIWNACVPLTPKGHSNFSDPLSNHSQSGCRLKWNVISMWQIQNDGESVFLTQVKSGFMVFLLKRHLLAYLDSNVQMCTLCQENASVSLLCRQVCCGKAALRCTVQLAGARLCW